MSVTAPIYPEALYGAHKTLISGLPGLRVEVDLAAWSAVEQRSAIYWFDQYALPASAAPSIAVVANPVPEATHWQDVGGERSHLFVDRCLWNPMSRQLVVDVPHPIRRRRRWYVAYGIHLAYLAGCVAGLSESSRRVLHGGAVEDDHDLAIATLGMSGQGKSTLCRVLGHLQLGDEVVCIDHRARTVSGTPVPGEFLARDLDARPLGLLVLPERSATGVTIRRLNKAEVVRCLLSAAIRLPGADPAADLDWATQLAESVPAIGLAWDQAGTDEPRHALLDWWRA